MRILVLGHKGMLGRAVTQYFSTIPQYTVLILNIRWGESGFKEALLEQSPDFIINCIGKIPQKQPAAREDYESINIGLPRFLDTLDIPVVHPSTDCEFKGNIAPGKAYTKSDIRDADDAYGISKATISQELEEGGKNTKIIRTSIIGHEESTSVALLDWFLSQNSNVRGYTNHYWNGVTTLEWAKQCQTLIEDWENYPILNQLGTSTHYSKFEIVSLAREIYEKDIEIVPFETEVTVNKCLLSDKTVPDLKYQLTELRSFFTH